eukprot:3460759-Amphidinium_carterae.3
MLSTGHRERGRLQCHEIYGRSVISEWAHHMHDAGKVQYTAHGTFTFRLTFPCDTLLNAFTRGRGWVRSMNPQSARTLRARDLDRAAALLPT